MVIFMPYYRQHGQLFRPNSRSRAITSASASSIGQQTTTTTTHPTTPTTTVHISACRFASSILCRWIFSLFLFTIALFLFQLSINNSSNKKEGSNIVAAILLTVAIVSFLRTCQTLRGYLTIMHTRRRLIQRLRERQQAYDLALANRSDSTSPDLIMGDNTDLPSYKELFPSHPNISRMDPSSTLSPPSYDDFVKTLVIRQAPTTLPLSSLRPHALSLPTTSLSTSTPTQTSPSRCIWITDRTRRPVCIRGTVTYV